MKKKDERRNFTRMPFNLSLRLRESLSNLTFPAISTDIHASGIQLETDAPISPRMSIEIWPEDYGLDAHYAHGEICWVKPPLNGNRKNRCGISFKRQIDWPIPLPVLTQRYSAYKGEIAPPKFILDSIVDGIFTVDQNKRITSFNKAVELLTGWSEKDALGKICSEVFKSNCCDTNCVLTESIRNQRAVENRTVFITHANGKRIGATISATPLFDEDNNVVGGVQVFRSVQSLLDRAVILDNISDGVFTVDTEWKLTSFNRAAEQITGRSRADVIGKPCHEVFQASICGKTCAIAASINSGQPDKNRCIHIKNVDDVKVPISICAAPMYDTAGNLIGGVETFRDLRPSTALETHQYKQRRIGDIITKSPAMNKVFDILPDIAEKDQNVLLVGESGTGKQLISRAIHKLSPRKDGPMVVVKCGELSDPILKEQLFGASVLKNGGAIPLGGDLFNSARGGLLFLDQIGKPPLAIQVKLLQLLERDPAETNVRIIATSATGSEDKSFYKLNVTKIEMPSLRNRVDDIQLLVEHFLEELNREKKRDVWGISEEALRTLMAYDFPGNIRELQNIVEYASILCVSGMIQTQHLPPALIADQ
ncbi:MAG: PAS domain-containing protein [Proteobacteria bacterium]|nr:PAS domain-containing protein [Pseudomonadota bacterium]MBU1639710.1 PAS domain-containing protein [Pseudomonadota bacterium]